MFGAIASGISNFANQVVGYNYDRDKRTWLEKQNALARFHNINLAKMQNTWNIEQWNRENAYNSPLHQRQLYAQAGMNPDLSYSQVNLAAQSPMLTSGAPTSPLGSDAYGEKPTWGNVGTSVMQGLESAARIRNINADTENKEADTDKKGAETKGLSIDNVYKALHHDKQLQIEDSTYQLNIANTKCSNEQANKLIEEIKTQKELTQIAHLNIIKVTNEIASIEADVYRKNMLNVNVNEEAKLLLRKLAAEVNISEAQAMYALQYEAAKLKGIQYSNQKLDLEVKQKLDEYEIDHLNKENIITANSVDEAINQFYSDNKWVLFIKELVGLVGQIFAGVSKFGKSGKGKQ